MTFEAILKKAKLKATPARTQVLRLFSEDCGPLNAESILGKLKSKRINQVTVYRTLASFEKVGIVKRVDLHKDSAFYELARHHHHHLICTECGLTEGFDGCDIEVVTKKALKHSVRFKKIKEHSLELFGVCISCSK